MNHLKSIISCMLFLSVNSYSIESLESLKFFETLPKDELNPPKMLLASNTVFSIHKVGKVESKKANEIYFAYIDMTPQTFKRFQFITVAKKNAGNFDILMYDRDNPQVFHLQRPFLQGAIFTAIKEAYHGDHKSKMIDE